MNGKKALSILVSLLLVCAFLAMPAAADDAVREIKFEAGLSTGGSNAETNGWLAYYIPVGSADLAAVKTDMEISDDTWWYAKIPGWGTKNAEGGFGAINASASNDAYAGFYLHAGQYGENGLPLMPGGDHDVGMRFTAPKAGKYRVDLAAVCAAYTGEAGTDGVKLAIYKNDFADANKLYPTGTDTGLITDTKLEVGLSWFDLAAGDKLYVRFNKNADHYSDAVSVYNFDVYYQMKDIVFPAVTPDKAVVTTGCEFPQFFNIAKAPGVASFWTPFYINLDEYAAMVITKNDKGSDIFTVPGATGLDVYAHIWDGLPSVLMPGDSFNVGAFFTAPESGTVRIDYEYTYDATDGDGGGITVYKNDLDTVLIERQVVSKAQAVKGKLENLTLSKGDKIIFVYDKNGNIYYDNINVDDLRVTYTAAPALPTLVETTDQDVIIGADTIQVPDTMTLQDVKDALTLSEGCALVFYDEEEEPIGDLTKAAGEAVSVEIVSAGNTLQLFTLTTYKADPAATTPPATTAPGNENANTGTGSLYWPVLLVMAASASFAVVLKKKARAR